MREGRQGLTRNNSSCLLAFPVLMLANSPLLLALLLVDQNKAFDAMQVLHPSNKGKCLLRNPIRK